MKTKVVPLLAFVCGISCNFINPKEQLPAYVHIDEYSFNTVAGEGTQSHKFTEIWVYSNDQIVGVYDLPASIPILEEGPANLSFFAGIKNFGLSSMRIKYPFVEGYRLASNLQPMKTDTIRPSFHYFENLNIVQKDWDATSPSIIPLSTNTGELLVEDQPEKVFEGDRCGYFRLPAGSLNLAFKDDQNFNFVNGRVTFLEMDYSCNNKFSVGLIARNGTQDIKNMAVIINPTTEGDDQPVWNKIYIDLGLIVREHADASYYEFYFEAQPDNPGDRVDLYLDNLKIVEFE